MKWLLFGTLTVWLYLIIMWVTARRRQMDDRVRRALPATRAVRPQRGEKPRNRVVSVRALARTISTHWLKKWSAGRLDKLQTKLAQAGTPFNLTVAEWMGLRFIVAGVGFVLGLLVIWMGSGQLSALLVLLALLLLGWIGPDFWLSRRVRDRQSGVLKQLPNALDLLTVSVEAGLGFDQALARVGVKMNGPLAQEFERVLREVQLGSQRAAALQRMAQRTGVDPVKTFVSAIVQAEKLGVGMAQVLRVQAAEVRRKRRMDAEERAMKAPVKMLFPLVVFVFPALFVIILGPAMIHIIQVFGSGNM